MRPERGFATRRGRCERNAGPLIAHGARRGRYYLAGDRVRQRRAVTDLPKVQTDPFRSDR
jgi:hypothetical protein